MSDDFDSPWKDILEGYFPDFMAFFFPAASAEIDWSRGFQPLDKELAQVVRDAELGRRYADKLIKVFLVDGSEEWLLVHIEVQGQRDPDFPERMFVSGYRLYDRYRRFIDWILRLPDDLELQYTDEVYRIEEGLQMPYVSFVERRGIALGEARGSARLLRGLLERRFGPLPTDALERLERADVDRLMAWGERVFEARTLGEVFGDAGPAAG